VVYSKIDKKMKFIIVLLIVTNVILSSHISVAQIQNLSYDNSSNQINITCDSLNRILTKNTKGYNTNFIYDKQYNGTLTNVTSGNVTYNYEYDSRLRITREIRVIDGIKFEKRSYYDSMDRLVSQVFSPGKTINYTYNDQGGVSSLFGYITSTTYDAFGNILTRNYANNLNTQFTYDSKNERLTQIKTSNLQQLNYSYDKVGNVISIKDIANNMVYSMVYDFLDRLVNVTINNDTYGYVYNSIGNILKITRGDWITYFAYGKNPVHAPSKIIPGNWVNSTLSINPTKPFIADRTIISCLVRDANTSKVMPNYKASIYIDNNLTISNTSDSKGFVNTTWNAINETHNISCQVGDDLHYSSSYNDTIKVTPAIRGNISFLCGTSTNSCTSKENEMISWLKQKGWNVTSKRYSNWSEAELNNYDFIVCVDETYACKIDSTTVAYKVHKNNSKPIVELSDSAYAKAAYYLGYVNTSYTTGLDYQRYINITSNDAITSGYTGKVDVVSQINNLLKVDMRRLNTSVINLAILKPGYSGLFKVNQSGKQGRFVWLGWLYAAHTYELNEIGTTILMRALNWAKCGNAYACV
jgi:hypothetical protein